jgi:hypothetical protein
MTADEFRRIALSMDGAIEGAHMGHPDFRANGKIFATLHPGNVTGMVKLPPAQQPDFIDTDPDTFTPAAGAWGRQGCTIVKLATVNEDQLGEAMTLAWQEAQRSAKTSKTKQSARRTKKYLEPTD